MAFVTILPVLVMPTTTAATLITIAPDTAYGTRGSWTPLVNTVPADGRAVTGQPPPNVPAISKIDLLDVWKNDMTGQLAGGFGIHGTMHDETRQFCSLVARAYNLPFWQGVSLVQTFVTALMHGEGPTQQRTAA